jgi:hypothetical protein
MRKAFVILLTIATVMTSALAAHAKPKYAVTVSANKTAIELSKGNVTLSGKVSPTAKGKTVAIQRKYGAGAWATIGTAKLSSSGAYAKAIKPAKAAVTSYRVVKSASTSRSSGVSPTVVVTVSRWRWVTDLPLHDAPVVGTVEATATMRGHAYPHSIIAGASAQRAYRTDNMCTRIIAYVGYEDRSVGSSGEATASRRTRLVPGPGPSGYSIYYHTPFVGEEPLYADIDISGSKPPAVSFGGNSTSFQSLIAWGSPRIYCAS